MRYWLLKSEPTTFSMEALMKAPARRTFWEGVRNYQARNYMRDEMQVGDQAFFYHSSCAIPGVVGIVQIVKTGCPDFTSWDPQSPYFDPKSSQEQPRWWMVQIEAIKQFKEIISLNTLKNIPGLKEMPLLRPGNRLSVIPVTAVEWKLVLTCNKV